VAALSTARSARSPISDAPCSQTQTSRVGKSRLLRAFVKQHVTSGSRRLPSTGAPRARLRRSGNPPPFLGADGHRAGFRRHAFRAFAQKTELRRYSGLITPKPGSRRRLSVSAIIAVLQHNRGQTVHPAHRQRSCPLGSVMRAALHLTVQGRPSCLGPGATEGRNPRQRPLGR